MIMRFVTPRAEIKNMQQLDKLSGAPSLYFLLGEELDGEEQAYIGQADDFLSRVIDQNQKKYFLNKSLVFIGNFNKSDVLYLEFLVLQEAQENSAYSLKEKALFKQGVYQPMLAQSSNVLF